MSEEIIFKGKWWIPSKSRKKIAGTLTIRQNGIGSLELLGLLDRESEGGVLKQDLDIIIGISTSGSKITLHNCRICNTCTGRTGLFSQTFEVDTIFIDMHAKSIERTKFKILRVYFQHLDQLITNSSVHSTINQKNGKQTVKISNPKPVSLYTSVDFDIKIHPSNSFISSHGASKKIEIEEISFISIESKRKELEYREYLKIIFKIQTLLTFCLSKPTYPTEIYGESTSSIAIQAEGNNPPIYEPIRIITHWNDLIELSDSESIHPYKIVFDFNRIERKRKKIVAGWFKKSDEFSSFFELYFATMFNSKMYLNHIYLTLAQCIENYNRKSPRYLDYLTDPIEYTKRIEIVKGALKEHSTLNNSQIKSVISWQKAGNKPSLENRIDAILKTYPSVAPIIKGPEVHFAKTIADNRNHLTHLDPKPGATYATFDELYYLVLRMRLLIITIILDEIGFQQEEIHEIIVKINVGFGFP
jgi:hypothetical protein